MISSRDTAFYQTDLGQAFRKFKVRTQMLAKIETEHYHGNKTMPHARLNEYIENQRHAEAVFRAEMEALLWPRNPKTPSQPSEADMSSTKRTNPRRPRNTGIQPT